MASFLRTFLVSPLTLVLTLAPLLSAQDPGASISVTVLDPAGAVVPAVSLSATDPERGILRQGRTDDQGAFTFDSLPPGDYFLKLSKTGFEDLRLDRLSLALRDRQSLRLHLRVSGSRSLIAAWDAVPAVAAGASRGIVLAQDDIGNLPVNGRSAAALVRLSPGLSSDAAGFHANGLGSYANYFTLDGLSLNSPAGGGPATGAGGLGANPSTGLISVDALQEIRVESSSFAPEFGRTPGAQISMISRGGANSLHGSLFYFFRNEHLSANDWFANSAGAARTKLRQNRPGGSLGGALRKDRTFYFASYEGLRLTTPQSIVTSVPDLRSRLDAPVSLRPYLNAFPLPTGAALNGQAAEFRAVVSNPSSSDSGSLRLDHILDERSRFFARFSTTPSAVSERSAPNVVTASDSKSYLVTTGWTLAASPAGVHDLRINYSRSDTRRYSSMDSFGGAVPLTTSLAFPHGVTAETGEFTLSVLGVGGYSLGGRSRAEQKQVHTVYGFTKTSPGHTFRMGGDYRRTMPTIHRASYFQTLTFKGIGGGDGALLSAVAANAQVGSRLDAVFPVYQNLSAYWQDTFRATERTTLTYGLRWDINPPPGVRQGPQPFSLDSSFSTGVTQNRPLYSTRWFDLAPRLGLAYRMDTTPGREMMLRLGLGLFYDSGHGAGAGPFNGAPYAAIRTISAATFPLSIADTQAPLLPETAPYAQLSALDANLLSPMIPQWSAAVERYFGHAGMLSIGYVGTRGRRLLRTESLPDFSKAYGILRFTANDAASAYHGLQVQYRRNLSSRLQTRLSYTYSHSIDTAAAEPGGGFASLLESGQRGSSDFDVRHILNFSGSYRLAAPSGFLRPLLGGWHIDWIASLRTGLPFDVQTVTADPSAIDTGNTTGRNLLLGLFALVRPGYNGLPAWLDDPLVPGGRRLNPAAFTAPKGYAQGNLARNALRGPGAFQADTALRREISVSETARLHISAQAFNLFNTPSFANLSSALGAHLASPNFGVPGRTLNQTPTGGASAIYRMGGARSVELAVRLQF